MMRPQAAGGCILQSAMFLTVPGAAVQLSAPPFTLAVQIHPDVFQLYLFQRRIR
jgi:hypothetical protein